MLPNLDFWACEPRALGRFLAKRMNWREEPLSNSAQRIEAASMARTSPDNGPVTVLNLQGVMLKDADALDEFFGAVSMRKLGARVASAANDPTVKAIVLLTDSPGGSVDGLEELGAIVKSAAEQKNVVTVVDGMAASAAYYVASQTREIVAGPTDLVGSIGTKLVMYDVSKAFDEAGIRVVTIDTGEYKSTGEIGTALSDAQKGYLQGIVDFYFGDFRAKVRSGRGMDQAKFDTVADGRLFPAPQAKALGLIDRVARPVDAIAGLVARHASRPRMAAMELRRKAV